MKKLIIGAASTIFLAAPALADDIQYDLKLEGITCPFCVATSERALSKIDGVKMVSGDLETGIIRVCAEDRVRFTDAQLTKVFLKKGFTYKGMVIHENCDGFDSTTVLSTEEMERRAAKHDTMGHGDEEMDFRVFVPADHDHDGDGVPDHGPEIEDDKSCT